jgi:tetratricopeptide (TPR) repeat protein
MHIGEVTPKVVNKEIKKHMRLARICGSAEYIVRLSLIRGEYYLDIKELSKAGKAFRRVMRGGSHQIEAMIGVAQSYILCKRAHKAQEWLERALFVAKDHLDYQGQLEVLDFLASRSVYSDWPSDNNKLTDLLEAMSNLVSNAPIGSRSSALTIDCLLERERGSECVHYLECWVERLLELGATYCEYGDVLYLLVNAYRQVGLNDEAIRDKLLSYKDRITDETIADMFISRVDRDINRRPSPTLRERLLSQNTPCPKTAGRTALTTNR